MSSSVRPASGSWPAYSTGPTRRANGAADRTLATVQAWTQHEDPAVRRLASEGTRPKLPWARQIPAIIRNPAATIPVLDQLYADESDFVRRSFANHLNDISRLDAGLAVRTARRWNDNPGQHTGAVIRKAMRSLVKSIRIVRDPDDPEHVAGVTQWTERRNFEEYLAWRTERGYRATFEVMLIRPFVIHYYDIACHGEGIAAHQAEKA